MRRQTGVVGERLGQVVAEVPAQAQPIGDHLHQLALGAEALEEQDQLQLEEDHRVDGGSPAVRVGVPDQVAHEAQIERPLQMAIEVNLAGRGPPASRVEAEQRIASFVPIMTRRSFSVSRVSRRRRILSSRRALFQHAGSFLRHRRRDPVSAQVYAGTAVAQLVLKSTILLLALSLGFETMAIWILAMPGSRPGNRPSTCNSMR